MLTVADRWTKELQTPVNGVLRLQAERRWIVHGDADEVADVKVHLGGVATPLTDTVLELNFGNGVGWYKAGPLGDIDVVSGKWTDADYEAMLARIIEAGESLPFSAGTNSALPYDRSALGTEDVLYHAFTYLRHIVGTPMRPSMVLVGPLRSILSRPHARTMREGRVVPVALARRVNPAVLVDVRRVAVGPCRRSAVSGWGGGRVG